MGKEKDNNLPPLRHETLADLMKDSGKIATAALLAGHTGEIPRPVVQSKEDLEKKNGNSATLPEKEGQRGRIFMFKPTGERVTVMKERVGNTYAGDWVHEVISRDGKQFLASTKQLADHV